MNSDDGAERLRKQGRHDAAVSAPSATAELSVLDLLNALLLHRRLMILLPLLFLIPVVVYSMAQPRKWESSASFIPQQGSPQSPLLGAAAQFGFRVPGTEPGESPAFYTQLLRSTSILSATVDSSYTLQRGDRTETVRLAEVLAPNARSEAERRQLAVRALQNSMSVSVGREAGVIEFTVVTAHPDLSRQVAANLLALIHEFNLERRQNQAAAERRFVEERLAQARLDLIAAETSLQEFQETNRRIESPQLVLQLGRMQHDVALRQHLVTSLSEGYERARIDEVRNLPLITVIDVPESAVYPQGRGTVMRSLIALFIGFGIAAVIAVLRTSVLAANASARPDVRLFRQLRSRSRGPAGRAFDRLFPDPAGFAETPGRIEESQQPLDRRP